MDDDAPARGTDPARRHRDEPQDPPTAHRTAPRADGGEDEADQRRGFRDARPGSLAEQPGGVVDDAGEDRRLYTGEPVETDDGWVLPEQQNLAGADNIAGGGEWPDPDTPPTEPPPAEPPATHEGPADR